MSIYLDVLIILNIYVNYFLLKATEKLTHNKLHLSRCIISSVVGSIFSLIIVFPPLNAIISLIFKLIVAIIVVGIAFGIPDKIKFIKLILFFYITNFIFAGVMFAVYTMIQPSFMHYNNSYFYIDFSLITLIISTIIAYFFVSLIRYFLDRKAVFNEEYSVNIEVNRKTVSLNAIADTGNNLIDVFSGQSVIICNIKKLNCILPNEYIDIFSNNNIDEIQQLIITHKGLNGLRIIPFSTINSNGIIPIFSPNNIYIKSKSSNKTKHVDALIGICEEQGNSYDAIFNPNLIL